MMGWTAKRTIREDLARLVGRHARKLSGSSCSKILDRVISVEYALREDGEPDRRNNPRDYGRCRSPYGCSISLVPRSRLSLTMVVAAAHHTMVTMHHMEGALVQTMAAIRAAH